VSVIENELKCLQEGKTPFHFASQRNDVELLTLLFAAGGSVLSRDKVQEDFLERLISPVSFLVRSILS
jgi:hypothetical protein